jgi:hypothetical protein
MRMERVANQWYCDFSNCHNAVKFAGHVGRRVWAPRADFHVQGFDVLEWVSTCMDVGVLVSCDIARSREVGRLLTSGKERIADSADPRATCNSVTAPNAVVLIASAHTRVKLKGAHVLNAPLSLFSKSGRAFCG